MRVRVGDVRLYFDVAGMELVPDGPMMRERPIVVCLHGGPGFDHSTLKPFLGPLEDEAQLIFLDHRGQGRSDESTPSRWTLDTWINDVAAFCDVLGIERPIILGQSFGGIVGLGIAIRYPELPARLVVSSSVAKFRPERALAMFEELGGGEAREVAARFFRNPNQESFDAFMLTCFPLYGRAPRDPDVRARVRLRPEVNFHFFGGELQTYNWFDDLNRIHCPTLILAGEVDPIATSWITRSWLPRSRGHGSRSFQTLDTACSATSPMRPLRLSAISSVLRVSQPRPLTYSATPALGRVVKSPDVVERTAR